jgi:RHS repeat-associated protein
VATFAYDTFDQITSVTTPQGTTGYTYDDAGRRTTMSVAGLPQVSYTYDGADRLTSITQGANSAAMSWDDADRLTGLSLPNQVGAAYSYDDNDQPTGIAWTADGDPLGELTYTYDPRGLPVAVGGSLAATTLPNQVTTTTYNAANQLTGWNGTTLAYDDDGHLTTDGTRTLTWNPRGQLSTVTTPTATVTHTYDPLERRSTINHGTQTTGFLYDGTNPVAATDTTGTPTSHWLTGLGLDSTLAITDTTGQTTTLISDALGSTIGEVDPAGTLTASYTYTPHGQATTTGSPASPVTYTGREADPTGLIYLRARYYDPQLSRFISPDPIGYASGDTNLYTYAFNNPTTYTDPTGLTPLALIGCAAGAAIGGGAAHLSGRKSGWGIAGAAISGCLAGATLGAVGGWAIRGIRVLRSPAYGIAPLPRGVLGSTSWSGQITIRPGLSSRSFAETLRHEAVHSAITPRSALGQKIREKMYNRSSVYRYSEEALAELYATRSLGGALKFPFQGSPPYTTGAMFTSELALILLLAALAGGLASFAE